LQSEQAQGVEDSVFIALISEHTLRYLSIVSSAF